MAALPPPPILRFILTSMEKGTKPRDIAMMVDVPEPEVEALFSRYRSGHLALPTKSQAHETLLEKPPVRPKALEAIVQAVTRPNRRVLKNRPVSETPSVSGVKDKRPPWSQAFGAFGPKAVLRKYVRAGWQLEQAKIKHRLAIDSGKEAAVEGRLEEMSYLVHLMEALYYALPKEGRRTARAFDRWIVHKHQNHVPLQVMRYRLNRYFQRPVSKPKGKIKSPKKF